MNITQIQLKVEELVKHLDKDTFIYDLLLAYKLPQATITLLKKGTRNKAKIAGDVILKTKLNFKVAQSQDLNAEAEQIAQSLKHQERFVIVTDFNTWVAIDTKTKEKLYIDFEDLGRNFDFFLPWAGMEKAQHHDENPADIKAAEKMAKLFDIIKKDNPDDSPEAIHHLNIFLSRLLFCFFAEDTHIFEENQFTNAVASHTLDDGSDLHKFLDLIFAVLNTPEDKRETNLPKYLNAFPYVNGGLFKENIQSPTFTRRSRIAVIDSGGQGWDAINPDIFGSMFQAVIGEEQRGNLGQHYTSVPNIMKVIEPLFLNELYEELEKAGSDQKKLNALLHRIHHIKIFDPACGSGNFLIIAYKELRELEMKIFKAGGMMALSGIQLSQFYGIEIDDFAGEIAKLALWLAEHQMNVAFFKEFGRTNPTLPLSEAGHIVQGNACRLDWEVVCPKTKEDEVYVLGNPPYLGYVMQNNEQKSDKDYVFRGLKNYKSLDYISCWFLNGAKYIEGTKTSLSFVSTNSVSKGEQVAVLWSNILNENIEIGFAHKSFKWSNSARSKAAVTVVIVGLRAVSEKKKFLFIDNNVSIVDNINAYLAPSKNLIVSKRNKPLSDFPIMMKGSQPTDGGNLLLTKEEKTKLIESDLRAASFIKRIYGAKEYIRGDERYCIWIEDKELEIAQNITSITERLEKVRLMRLSSSKKATQKLAITPYKFGEIRFFHKSSIIAPTITSERRDYIPCGFLSNQIIVSNTAQAIYDYEPYILGIITSKMMMVWIQSVGGRFKTDYIFSSSLCYNTFPFPNISTQRKNEITQAVMRILEEREKHSEKTLAQLYDPDKMPEGLREGHRHNDMIIERCYREKPFTSDEERLEYLFKLYEKMVAAEEVKVSKGGKKK